MSARARRSKCPIAHSLDILGDRWTLLVLRDILFKDCPSFQELAAGEAIATNILSDRLARLEKYGLIKKRRDDTDRRRRSYLPTEMAIDLVPLLLEFVVWGTRHTAGQDRLDLASEVSRDREGVTRSIQDSVRQRLAGLP